MKKIIAVLLIMMTFAITSTVNADAFGSYRVPNTYKYIVFYTRPKDDHIVRTISTLKSSIVDVSFSTKPWTEAQAKEIQDVYCSSSSGYNTIINIQFESSGQPGFTKDPYSAAGVPANSTIYNY